MFDIKYLILLDITMKMFGPLRSVVIRLLIRKERKSEMKCLNLAQKEIEKRHKIFK